MNTQLKPIQTGGMFHVWQSPDRSFKHMLLKLDLSCEQDKHPGVLVLADANQREAITIKIKNLYKEFSAIRAIHLKYPIAYWWREDDEKVLAAIILGLTESPELLG